MTAGSTECSLRARRRGLAPAAVGLAVVGDGPGIRIHLVHGRCPTCVRSDWVRLPEILGHPTISRHARFPAVPHPGPAGRAERSLPDCCGERSPRTARAGGAGAADVAAPGLRPGVPDRDRPVAGHPGRDPERHHRRVRHRLRGRRGLAAQRCPEDHPGDHRRARPRAGPRGDGDVRRRRHRRDARRLEQPGRARPVLADLPRRQPAPGTGRGRRSSTCSTRAA